MAKTANSTSGRTRWLAMAVKCSTRPSPALLSRRLPTRPQTFHRVLDTFPGELAPKLTPIFELASSTDEHKFIRRCGHQRRRDLGGFRTGQSPVGRR